MNKMQQRTSSSPPPSSRSQKINVKTNTEIKKVHIVWSLDRQNLDVALSASQSNKRDVLATVVQYDGYELRFELCVGWRRSLQGFSAFFLTVPLSRDRDWKAKRISQPSTVNTIHVRDNQEDDTDEEDKDNYKSSLISAPRNTNFIGKYTVSFGNREQRITRISSIRCDFDLGVGFPNFCELSKLADLMTDNMLEIHIDVEMHERSSTMFEPPSAKYMCPSQHRHIHPVLSKLYHEKLYCDAKIVGHYFDEFLVKKYESIKLHRSILSTASSVFAGMLQLPLDSIDMREWHINTILSLVKFLYLGGIELYHTEMRANDGLSLSIQKKEYKSAADMDGESEEVKTMDEDVKCCDDESCAASAVHHVSDRTDEDTTCQLVPLSEVYQDCTEDAQRLLSLFEMAEKYELPDLIDACCDQMLACITPSTCCVFLCYLEKYSKLNEHMACIKQYLLHYIVSHIRVIKRSKGYCYILQSRHELLSELIAQFNPI